MSTYAPKAGDTTRTWHVIDATDVVLGRLHHSGHPGGLKSRTVGEVLAKNPDRLVENAVKGMIPKNKLGNAIVGKLKVYAGPNHPHAAQQPVPFEIKQVSQ